MTRRIGQLLLAILVASSSWLGHNPAEATGFRYWTYWTADSTGWHFASAGPFFTKPNVDGWVEGWRFSTSDPYGPVPPAPRAKTTYSQLCHDPAQLPNLRIAIVIDYGLPADAPPGDKPPSPSPVVVCTTISRGTNSFDALKSKVAVRANQSTFICGLNGYPRTECADVGSGAPPPATPLPTQNPASTRSALPTHSQIAPAATSRATASTTAAVPTLTKAGVPLAVAGTLSAAPFVAASSQRRSGFPLSLVLGGIAAAGVGGLAWRRGRGGHGR